MLYDEQDLNFSTLNDKQFEELCFELILKLGYQSISWRKCGADNGRDLEGDKIVENPLVGSFIEKWFFECKNYSKGVPPSDLNSKIAWADAEKPDHLVFFISSFVSNNCRTWLEKNSRDKPYRIHVIEGASLKKLILPFTDLVNQYFLDEYGKLVLETRKTWLIHNLIPEPQVLKLIINNINMNKLDVSEVAFLWSSAKMRNEEITDFIEDSEPFYVNSLFMHLIKFSNVDTPILNTLKSFDLNLINYMSCHAYWEFTYKNHIAAEIQVCNNHGSKLILYSFVRDNDGEGVEVMIEQNSKFNVLIRHVKEKAKNEMKKANEIILKKPNPSLNPTR